MRRQTKGRDRDFCKSQSLENRYQNNIPTCWRYRFCCMARQKFIDSTDHGRQLQSAANFDNGSRYTNETFNPTEAGSRFDSDGKTSTSLLLKSDHGKDWLQTTTQMAFWLRPKEKSLGNLAKNKTRLSNHLITKRVQIGCLPGML